MYLVSQTSCLLSRFDDEEAIRRLAAAGFDGIDCSFYHYTNSDNCIWWSDDWKEYAIRLKETADECGIAFRQAHAPFHTSLGEEPYDTVVMERIRRTIEISAFLGVKTVIIHPKQHLVYAENIDELYQMNLELYRSLIPLCEKYNIHVCTENMWQYEGNTRHIIDSVCARPEEFCRLLDEIDSPWIVGCLDIGHAFLTGHDPAEFIRTLGSKRLKALHVHDVDGIIDNHNLPFLEKINWESVCQALGEIGYEGDFTYECDAFLYKFPTALIADGHRFMEKVGRYLISRVEAHRK